MREGGREREGGRGEGEGGGKGEGGEGVRDGARGGKYTYVYVTHIVNVKNIKRIRYLL